MITIKAMWRRSNINNKSLLHWPEHVGTKCPECQRPIIFTKNGRMDVRAHSNGTVYVPYFLMLKYGCSNPLCKWSTVQAEDDEEDYE